MKVGILGAGTMGGLFAGRLHRAGIDTVMLDRSGEIVDRVRRNGLAVTERDGVVYRHHIPAFDPRDFRGRLDVVVMLVKGPYVRQALQDIMPGTTERTMIASLVNGLGHAAHILPHFGADRTLIGTTAMGAYMDEPGRIRWTYEGDTYLGPVQGDITEAMTGVRDLLRRAGCATLLTPRIDDYIWTKLMINIAYNALTAVLNMTNGQLAGSRHGRSLMEKVVREAVKVAEQRGVTLHVEDPYQAVLDIAEHIGPNRSSMLRDVDAGRPTEIEALNGAVARLGREAGIDVTANEMVADLVRIKESTYSSGEVNPKSHDI